MPVKIADLCRATCKIILEKGSIDEIYKYGADIKLKNSICTHCAQESPTIDCDEYTICAICGSNKNL